MSLPKPDLHVRLTDEAAYWLRTIATVEDRPAADVARELLTNELARRAEQMTRVAKRLVADGRVRGND